LKQSIQHCTLSMKCLNIVYVLLGFSVLLKYACHVFVGTLAVSVSFPFFFLRCFPCVNADMWGYMSYYAPFIALFQFGWASTQVAHMTLMSQLTQDKSEQTELSGLRYVTVEFSFSLSHNVFMYLPCWLYGMFAGTLSSYLTCADC